MITTKKNTGWITLRTVLDHVQVNGMRLASLEEDMKKEFKAVHEKMDTGFTELHQNIDGVERRLTRQIDGLDTRLDDIEVNVVPALKKTVAAR